MNKIAINILIVITILTNNGCMTTEGIDYNPANNNTDKYASIKNATSKYGSKIRTLLVEINNSILR